MSNLSSYETFNPTFSFALNFREMNRREADEYFSWFKQQIPVRIEMLQSIVGLGANISEFSPQSLTVLGNLLDENVEFRHLSGPEILHERANSPSWFQDIIPDKALSERTISLCVDIGIAFGEMLTKCHSSLSWVFHHKQKNDANYQQPVIVGFKHKVELNPVRLLTVVAYKVADGQVGQNQLTELFYTWIRMV